VPRRVRRLAVARLGKAALFGAGAALVGAVIWYGIRRATDYELGLIAVVVGLMVGGAVRAGSGGRGGAGYQLLAVLLTYLGICANYAPDVYGALVERGDSGASLIINTVYFTVQFPFLAGFENIIGILIIGFALWEAWKINTAQARDLAGPYAIGGGPVPGVR
jgi:hypothetical protein